MKLLRTLRAKLTLFHLVATVLTISMIVLAISLFYQYTHTREIERVTQSTLVSLSNNLKTYLDDLERLTIMPYLDEDIMQALNAKLDSEKLDDYDNLLIDRVLKEKLPLFLLNTREDIIGTILITMDNSVYLTPNNSMYLVKEYEYNQQEWYLEAIESDGDVVFVGPHKRDYLKNDSTAVFSVARLIVDLDSRQKLGVVVANANYLVLEKIFQDIDYGVSSQKMIIDSKGKLIYSSKGVSDEVVNQVASGKKTIDINGKTFINNVVEIDGAKWKIAVLLSNDELKEKTRFTYRVGLIASIFGIFVTIIFFTILSKNIVNPVSKIIGVMEEVKQGNIQARVDITGENEVAELGNALNEMIQELDNLIQSEYMAKIKQKDAEYAALQAQIEPHFLYNTLNGFVALNRMEERQLLEKAILSLTVMLRYTLEGGKWTTIEKEFIFLEKYCNLQQMRLQEKLTFVVEYDKEIKDFIIPKLLLQPVVENSIIHGIEPIEGLCELIISAKKTNENIVDIIIKDTGTGFDVNEISNNSVGLANIKERLLLAYQDASIDIKSQISEGTTIEIKIPMEGERK